MKILEFADLDTSRVKAAYRKMVAAIANGDFRAAQVRKLAGAGHGKLYRARLNDADRLIFCLLRHNDDICALMLEVIVNHDYEKSRFLRGAVIDEDKIVDCDAAEAQVAVALMGAACAHRWPAWHVPRVKARFAAPVKGRRKAAGGQASPSEHEGQCSHQQDAEANHCKADRIESGGFKHLDRSNDCRTPNAELIRDSCRPRL